MQNICTINDMSVKSEILKLLYEKETVSGEVMAGKLG